MANLYDKIIKTWRQMERGSPPVLFKLLAQNIKKGNQEQLVTTHISDSVNCGFIYCSRVIFAAYNRKLNNGERVNGYT